MIIEKCICSGVVRDFAGPYFVSEDNMAFGKPAKYWKLDPARWKCHFFVLTLFAWSFLETYCSVLCEFVKKYRLKVIISLRDGPRYQNE